VVVVVVRVVVVGGGACLVVVVVVTGGGSPSSSSSALVVVVVVVDVALVVLVVDDELDVRLVEVTTVLAGRRPGGMGSTAALSPCSLGFWLAAPLMIPVVKSAAVRAPTTAPTASRPGPVCRVAPIGSDLSGSYDRVNLPSPVRVKRMTLRIWP
jgi:hypothetical protein